MKDTWDKAQIILQIILGALGAILIPIIIVIVGGTISRSITQAQIESSSQIAQAEIESSSRIAESQIKSSDQIAQAQLTKDYISMLAQAVSKGDDKELQVILDSLAALKNIDGGIPSTIVPILIRIGRDSEGKNRIQQSVERLVSAEDRKKLESYFERED